MSSPSSLCSSSASHSYPAFGLFVSPLSLTTCRLYFLSTSDLQMNCMLRSWSTRPLVRSWTMPLMTWHLCRCSDIFLSLPLTSLSLSCALNSYSLCGSYCMCLLHIFLCRKWFIKNNLFPTLQLLSLKFNAFVKWLMHNLNYVLYFTMHSVISVIR